MRTIEIGACTPPKGTTPGIRRPVRTITFPPISSRRMRFGEPTPSRSSGAIVAAFKPKPWSRIACAASRAKGRGFKAEAVLANRLRGLVDDLVLAGPPGLQRKVEPGEFEVEPGDL